MLRTPLGKLRRRGEISRAFRPKPLAHAGGPACAFDTAATVRVMPHSFPYAGFCINRVGRDPLVRGRPPGRPVELWKDLILRAGSGTGASRADQGVRPTELMQDPDRKSTRLNSSHL